MSVNLVSLLAQYLSPELITRIAAALGVDKTLLGRAATALSPALLRILAGLASTPAGARKLAGTIERQDPGVLQTLESAIGGAGQHSLVQEGVQTLESLLGGSAVSNLGGALTKLTGIGGAAGSSLIGVLTPAVLGVLGKEQAAQGLDASGLAKLLAAQKDNISAALPKGFGDLLSSAGLPGFSAGEARAEPAPAATRPPQSAIQSPFRWVLAAAAALGLLAWWALGRGPGEVVQPPKNTAGQAVQNLSVDGVDLKSSVQTAFDGLRKNLQGISDTASAQTALPKLETGGAEFDKLRGLAAKLPLDAKGTFAALVTAARPSIEDLFNKVLAIPGVAAIAKPVIDNLRVKLDALAKPEVRA